jgi:hypothetical protein
MTKSTGNARNWYTDFWANWPKGVGRQPTAAELSAVHAIGYREGKQALFAAMCLRENGATRPEGMLVCGAPQFNKTFGKGGTVAAGYFKRLPHEQRNSHVVYKIELTAKGTNKAKPVAAETAKPVVKKAKVKKAKPVQVDPVQPEAPTVVAAETPEAQV